MGIYYPIEQVINEAETWNWNQFSCSADLDKYPIEFFERFRHNLFWGLLAENLTMRNEISHNFIEEFGGTIRHYKDGRKHREDGPAVIYPDGDWMWYKEGYLHREDGPAFYLHKDGEYRWYKNGKKHRENGPAQIHEKNGFMFWYKNDFLEKHEILNKTIYGKLGEFM